MNQQLNTESLLENLSQFGLNPSHWEIIVESETLNESEALVIKKQDPEICFMGIYVKSAAKLQWQSLEVLI